MKISKAVFNGIVIIFLLLFISYGNENNVLAQWLIIGYVVVFIGFMILYESLLQKKIKEGLSFPHHKNVSRLWRYYIHAFEYGVWLLPAIWFVLIDQEKDFSITFVMIEAALGLVIVLTDPIYNWVIFTTEGLETIGIGNNKKVKWDKVYRVEINSKQIKLSYPRKKELILKLMDFSESDAQKIQLLFEKKIEQKQMDQVFR